MCVHVCAYVCTCALCITHCASPAWAGQSRGRRRVHTTCWLFICVGGCESMRVCVRAALVCVLFVDKHCCCCCCCCFVSITLMRLLMPSSRAICTQVCTIQTQAHTRTHTHREGATDTPTRRMYMYKCAHTYTRTHNRIWLLQLSASNWAQLQLL